MIIHFLPGFSAAQQTITHLTAVAERTVELVNQRDLAALGYFLDEQGVEFSRLNLRNLCVGYGVSYPERIRIPSLLRTAQRLACRHIAESEESEPRSVSELIEDLNDRRTADRAASDLGIYGDARAVRPLVQAALETQGRGRPVPNRNALQALQEIGDSETVDLMMEALKSPIFRTRGKAAAALGHLGDLRAVIPLAQTLLRDPQRSVRCKAALALGDLCDAKAVPALIGATNGDPDNEVRACSAEALGYIGDLRAIPSLIKAVKKDPDRGVRRLAVRSLAKFRDPRAFETILKTSKEGERTTQKEALRVLESLNRNKEKR